jgi:hypothetical protein
MCKKRYRGGDRKLLIKSTEEKTIRNKKTVDIQQPEIVL